MLTLDQIRSLVETDLSNDALRIVAESEWQDLINRYGDDLERTITVDGGHADIVLLTPALSIDTITEITHWGGEVRSTELETDDYVLKHGGRVLHRVGSGTNPSWAWTHQVSIVYTPQSREAIRNRVHADLIKLAIQFNGSREEWFGDYRVKFGASYHTTREQIMRQMASNRGMILA